MLDLLIKLAIARRNLVMVVVAIVAVLGLWNFNRLPIDAVPDITNVQVMINTEAAGFTPLEVEQRITYPLETALAGLPGLEYTRSVSRYGLSQVIAIFSDDTDIYFARQLVGERMASASGRLPYGLQPEMGPIATGLGEIFMFTVDAEPGAMNADGSAITPMDLRSVHDWIIRPQLMQVPGVVEVNPIGGYEREVVVQMQPQRMLSAGISSADIVAAIRANNENRGAGFVERNGAQWLMRIPGQAMQADDIAAITITAENGKTVHISDVAEVTIGHGLRTGAATQNGREVVMSTVFMLVGENSRTVASNVGKKLAEINASLPEGMIATAAYDRTGLVEKTLSTVTTNLVEGALLVIVILFLMLGNIRAAILTALVIPLAMLMTFTGMVQTRVSANLMSLGALDFGLLVDGAIIIVENCLRRLSQQTGPLALKERLQLVFEATREVIRPALFGVFIITAVYAPIFALEGVEGKMFHPMAITVVIALLSAILLSVTFVPAAVALLFRGPVTEKHNPLVSALMRIYQPLLALALQARVPIIGLAAVLVLLSIWQATRLGSEFAPNLDEGDIAMHALRIPGTSLSQAIALQETLEERIKALPEVERVFAKIGTADVATDAVPPSVADNFIILKPRDQWPDPDKPKQQVVAELEALVSEIPGNRYEFLQPIQMRFNELLAGVRAEVAIKIFGDDLDVLTGLGASLEKIVAGVDGAVDIQTEQVTGLPLLEFIPDAAALRRHGISRQQLQNQLSTALGGEVAGTLFEGDRRADITVRLPETVRADIDGLNYLPVTVAHGQVVPLQELVTLSENIGVNQVNRENGKRRLVVTANVRGRDLGSFVEAVRNAVGNELDIPSGYWVEYGGTYQKLQSASQRLMIVVPLTLVLIVGLLVLALNS
ncbi:efflux RND transporter permease subunit, partial [Thalassolituus marinus]